MQGKLGDFATGVVFERRMERCFDAAKDFEAIQDGVGVVSSGNGAALGLEGTKVEEEKNGKEELFSHGGIFSDIQGITKASFLVAQRTQRKAQRTQGGRR